MKLLKISTYIYIDIFMYSFLNYREKRFLLYWYKHTEFIYLNG